MQFLNSEVEALNAVETGIVSGYATARRGFAAILCQPCLLVSAFPLAKLYSNASSALLPDGAA
jgi:hypothetical protein